MKVFALRGSPRANGNSSVILERFLDGAKSAGANVELEITDELDIETCKGCLRCNVLKRCSLRDEEWKRISDSIEKADILVFATPIYFHHFTSSLKKVLDRFRSFFHIRITENGLIHTPWKKWSKEIVLIATMGSPSREEASPLIDLINYIKNILGDGNNAHTLLGTRLAVSKQVLMDERDLKHLYGKLGLPLKLAEEDFLKNSNLLEESFKLGAKLGGRN